MCRYAFSNDLLGEVGGLIQGWLHQRSVEASRFTKNRYWEKATLGVGMGDKMTDTHHEDFKVWKFDCSFILKNYYLFLKLLFCHLLSRLCSIEGADLYGERKGIYCSESLREKSRATE